MGLLSLVTNALFGCATEAPYHKVDGTWYWKKESMGIPSSTKLRPLNDHFAVAGSAAYFRSELVTGASGASFEALDKQYARDAQHVYFGDDYRKGQEYFAIKHHRITIVQGAHSPTFRLLGHGYARDTGAVYYDGFKFPVADVATYERIDETYARDRIRGYFGTAEIPGSDGATFVPVDHFHSKDRRHVFYTRIIADEAAPTGEARTVQLIDANPATFVVLEDDRSTDGTHTYHKGIRVDGATRPQ